MYVVSKEDGGWFYLEKDQFNQWLLVYNDASWRIATEDEITMWKLIMKKEHINISA
jgi:hypothetical protein